MPSSPTRHPVASRCVDCCHKWPPPSLPPSRYPYFRRQLYCSSLFPLPISRLPHPMRWAMGAFLPPSQGPARFNEQFLPPKSISVSAAAAAYGQSVNGAAILSRLDARCQPEIGGASEAGRRPSRPPCALSFRLLIVRSLHLFSTFSPFRASSVPPHYPDGALPPCLPPRIRHPLRDDPSLLVGLAQFTGISWRELQQHQVLF